MSQQLTVTREVNQKCSSILVLHSSLNTIILECEKNYFHLTDHGCHLHGEGFISDHSWPKGEAEYNEKAK